jgi:hypothetical protein
MPVQPADSRSPATDRELAVDGLKSKATQEKTECDLLSDARASWGAALLRPYMTLLVRIQLSWDYACSASRFEITGSISRSKADLSLRSG